MQFRADCKIEKCVSKDVMRENLTNVVFTGRHLLSSDGHVMAWIPATPDKGDTPGPIQPKAIEAARKATPKKISDAQINANGDIQLLDGTKMPRSKDATVSISSCTTIIKNARHNKGQTFRIDLNNLNKVADALGTEILTLTLPETNSKGEVAGAIFVRPNAAGEGLALVMSMHLDD
jgi:hypothetical protein